LLDAYCEACMSFTPFRSGENDVTKHHMKGLVH